MTDPSHLSLVLRVMLETPSPQNQLVASKVFLNLISNDRVDSEVIEEAVEIAA